MSHSSESNGAMNATEGVGSGGACSSATSSARTKRLPAHALDLDGHERAELDQLLAQLVALRRVGDAGERAAGAAGAEQAVGAVPGQQLVPELLPLRHLVRQHLGREQPFEEVVVAEVAFAPREADHARDGVRLEHGAHGVLRHPEPVLRRTALALEVGRGQRPVRPDALEHALGDRGVLGEGGAVEARPLAAPDVTEPRELARRDERQRLVGRLEDLTALVEHVAPGGLVAGHARVQHEVVVSAGDRDRVELDRPEPPEDLEHPVEAARERPRRREEVPRDEKATRRLSGDLHLGDIRPNRFTGAWARCRARHRFLDGGSENGRDIFGGGHAARSSSSIRPGVR